jgi:hypothetical protein
MRNAAWIFAILGLVFLSCGGDDTEEPSDTTAPLVTITQPADGASVAAGNVTIQAQATDNEDVDFVEFYVDGTKIGTDNTAAAGDTYSYVWDASGLAASSAHTIRVRAVDTSGNDDEDTIDVTIASGGGGPTYHSENITTDETWHKSGNPHIVTQDISVWEGGSLTILPGCIVKFDQAASIGCGWTTEGEIVAVGKPDTTILFTSNETTPAPGDWDGLGFFEGMTANTRLSYCTIEYAGPEDGQAVYVAWGAGLRMDYCTIRESAGRGIYYEHSGHVVQFHDNTITECAKFPLALDPEFVRHLGTGNDYTGNAAGFDAIEVYYGGVETTATWKNQGVPYRITENSNVWVGTTETAIVLTIEAGTTIEFETNAEMTIGNIVLAGLVAEGTSTDPITFTSAAASPQPGDWNQVWIAGEAVDAQCRLSHCVFEYGGGGPGEIGGMLWISSSDPEIEACAFNNSSRYGIFMEGDEHPDPSDLRAANTFSGNASGDVYLVVP